MPFLKTTDASSEDRRLPPPPRVIPPGLTHYLRWASFNIGLTFLGFALIAFWGDCGFGADFGSLLFLSPITHTAGTVVHSERTGVRVGVGSSSLSRSAVPADTPSVPVFAVYFSYTAPAGTRRTGVCFANGSRDKISVPVRKVADPVGAFAAPPSSSLASGTPVVVETVDHGRFARIQGTRTNLYEMHMLIVLVFPGLGVFLLLGARRHLRCALPLLATGKEDPAKGRIVNPTNAARSVSLTTFPFNRVRAQGGLLQVPPLAMRRKIWIGPGMALICNIWYIADNAKGIFYPFKVLLGHGY